MGKSKEQFIEMREQLALKENQLYGGRSNNYWRVANDDIHHTAIMFGQQNKRIIKHLDGVLTDKEAYVLVSNAFAEMKVDYSFPQHCPLAKIPDSKITVYIVVCDHRCRVLATRKSRTLYGVSPQEAHEHYTEYVFQITKQNAVEKNKKLKN